MTSQLTSIVATQQQADHLAAAERSRRAAVSTKPAERSHRVLRVLRRRPAMA